MTLVTRSQGSPLAYVVALITPQCIRIAHAGHIGEAKLIQGEFERGVFEVPCRIQWLK